MVVVAAEMTMMLLFTLVVGAVVFGGVTLVYLRSTGDSDPAPTPVRTQQDAASAAADDARWNDRAA